MGTPVELWEIALRLLLAALAGAVLGWEREKHQKPAGLRTHMMVALGGAIFMAVSLRMIHTVSDGGKDMQYDLLRVMQGVIGGVGFLGAGAIIQSGGSVRGLTTAASIWLAAAIGVTCGVGQYEIAGLSAGLGLLILMGVGMVEYRVLKEDNGDKRGESGKTTESETPPSD